MTDETTKIVNPSVGSDTGDQAQRDIVNVVEGGEGRSREDILINYSVTFTGLAVIGAAVSVYVIIKLILLLIHA